MLLQYKEDWPAAAARLEAWWNREVIDRVCLQVTAPKVNYRPREIPRPKTLLEKWTDPDYIIETNEETFRSTFWGGEAFPALHVNLGPGIMGAFFGCEPVLAEETAWQQPLIDDWDSFPGLSFDPANRWWQAVKTITRRAVERGKGRYFTAMTDLGGAVDVLSLLRGPERLCTDLVYHPERVKGLRRFLSEQWRGFYDELHRDIQTGMTGSSSWLRVWSPGKMYPLQCDFSNLISPEMFREFCLPELEEQSKWLDHVIYHLDGPGELRHLDHILAVEGIDVIQWVPLPDKRRKIQWIPLFKQIQKAGKGLHLLVDPDEIEPLLAELSPRGLLLRTQCASEAEAKDLLKQVAKWTKNRP